MSISQLAQVSGRAKIGSGVTIGAFSIINDNVVIEDNVHVGSHCVLGAHTVEPAEGPLVIRKNSLIRSHCVLYESSEFGEGLQTGHHVTTREKIIAGKSLRIGTLSDLQGYQTLGHYVRLHSNVFISQHACIKDYVWVFPHTVLTDDPHPPSEVRLGVTLEDYAIVAASCCLLPGVKVGSRALVGAGSVVKHDVEPGWVVVGQPAKPLIETSKLRLKDGSGEPAYPWTRHFHRGYPENVVSQWIALAADHAADRSNPSSD